VDGKGGVKPAKKSLQQVEEISEQIIGMQLVTSAEGKKNVKP
jgi:hypothetical protein